MLVKLARHWIFSNLCLIQQLASSHHIFRKLRNLNAPLWLNIYIKHSGQSAQQYFFPKKNKPLKAFKTVRGKICCYLSKQYYSSCLSFSAPCVRAFRGLRKAIRMMPKSTVNTVIKRKVYSSARFCTSSMTSVPL